MSPLIFDFFFLVLAFSLYQFFFVNDLQTTWKHHIVDMPIDVTLQQNLLFLFFLFLFYLRQ